MEKEAREFYSKMQIVFVSFLKNNFYEQLFIKFMYDDLTEEQPFDYRWGPGPEPVFEEDE